MLRWLCVLSVASALKHSPSKRKSISRPARGALEAETGDGIGEYMCYMYGCEWTLILCIKYVQVVIQGIFEKFLHTLSLAAHLLHSLLIIINHTFPLCNQSTIQHLCLNYVKLRHSEEKIIGLWLFPNPFTILFIISYVLIFTIICLFYKYYISFILNTFYQENS
mgnify:CR=1 FL=1